MFEMPSCCTYWIKSSKLNAPSPSKSALLSISSISACVTCSPRLHITCVNSSALIRPFPSLSKTMKASRISSTVSDSCSLEYMMLKNSSKSTSPLPSSSTSAIILLISGMLGFLPSERNTSPISSAVIVPSPFLSKTVNASLNSSTSHFGRPNKSSSSPWMMLSRSAASGVFPPVFLLRTISSWLAGLSTERCRPSSSSDVRSVHVVSMDAGS
mmetsp:Transcript_11924/g.32330  ORF Transcript_11924/g.32330 Transcript_11924/m.32330 type:complete len:213 (+) Transcript_11924:253-891(+)